VSFGPSVHTPAVDYDGTVYVTDEGGFLHAVDRVGQLLWSVHLGVDLYAGPALGLDGTTLVTAGGMLFAVSTAGTVQWSEPLPADRFVHEPAVDSNGVCVVTGSGGTVTGIMTDAGVAGTRVIWQVRPSPGRLTAASMDGHGRIYVGDSAGALHAIDDAPAFQLFAQSDMQQAGNLDVYSLRESYGILDPARTVRVTRASSADRQPATSLDRRVIGYVSHRVTSDDTMVATPRGTREEVMTPPGGAFSATSDETSPAFTPIDDLLGTPKSPHLNEYVAVTSNESGLRRLVFVDLAQPVGSPTAVRPFTPWAAALGVPPALLSQLEPAAVEQSHAAFSPDGRKVAWRAADPSSASGQVWLLWLSSSGWQLVPVGPSYPYNPENPSPVSDEPCFSPDSRWIAVRQGLSLAIYDVASASPPVFTKPPQTADEPFHPSWSPDGTEIAIGVRRGGPRDLHIASGTGFATYVELTGTGDSDEPSYDSFKMPPPRSSASAPTGRCPTRPWRCAGAASTCSTRRTTPSSSPTHYGPPRSWRRC